VKCAILDERKHEVLWLAEHHPEVEHADQEISELPSTHRHDEAGEPNNRCDEGGYR
jgi:hypothetical protein